MHVRRALAIAGAVTAAAFAACKEHIPFTPSWDADMYLPLSTQPIHLPGFFTFGFIPPSTSGTVSFPPQKQDVTGTIADVLKKLETDPTRCGDPTTSCDSLTLTVTKHTAISGQDTLFIAKDSASLFTPDPLRVVFPVSFLASDTLVTSSMRLSQNSVGMLKDAAYSTTPLWIQMRGKVSNPSTSPIAITNADSIVIKLAMTVRIAISPR
jgi:hypothetical protein